MRQEFSTCYGVFFPTSLEYLPTWKKVHYKPPASRVCDVTGNEEVRPIERHRSRKPPRFSHWCVKRADC